MSKPEKDTVQISIYFHGMQRIHLKHSKTVSSICNAVSSLLTENAEIELESKVCGTIYSKGAKFIFRSADITVKTFQLNGKELVAELGSRIKPLTKWSYTIKQSSRLIF